MSYSGFLINVNGNYDINMHYIVEKSYEVTWSTLDIDSYRDANGVLHRNAVIQVPQVVFETKPLLDYQVEEILSNIRANYVSSLEKKVLLTVFVPELNNYYTGYFYMPDTNLTIRQINDDVVRYEPISFKFIGYGG